MTCVKRLPHKCGVPYAQRNTAFTRQRSNFEMLTESEGRISSLT
jgi:hypothetical protein